MTTTDVLVAAGYVHGCMVVIAYLIGLIPGSDE